MIPPEECGLFFIPLPAMFHTHSPATLEGMFGRWKAWKAEKAGAAPKTPERKRIAEMSNEEMVEAVRKGFEQEFKRLHIHETEKLDRLSPDQVSFEEIPKEDNTVGYFQLGVTHGAAWMKLVVESRRDPKKRAKTLTHEALHALSSREKTYGGASKYLRTLAQHGYSGLDEGITEHYTQFMVPRIYPEFQEEQARSEQQKENQSHSYAHLVEFVERTLRRIAENFKGDGMTDEEAYEQARDFLYTVYLGANHETMVNFFNYNGRAPGMGEIIGAIPAPYGSEGSKHYVSHEDSKLTLQKTEKLMELFARSRTPEKKPEPGVLSIIVDKWYLDPKNYPGYPDKIKDEFVAEAIYAHHYWSVAEMFNANLMLDPLSIKLHPNEARGLLGQAQLIEEDLRIMKQRYKGSFGHSYKLEALSGILRVLGHAQDQGGVRDWNAIRDGIRADPATPEGQATKQHALRAWYDLRADLMVFAGRYGSRLIEDIFTYMKKRLEGDVDARIKVERPEI